MASVIVFAHQKDRIGRGRARIIVEHHLLAQKRRRAYEWTMNVDLDSTDISEYLERLQERAREFGRRGGQRGQGCVQAP